MNIDIILIGCGGTGGCFFSRFVRFMADNVSINANIHICIMDGDFVEQKNLARQPFCEDDIGHNKAVVLASAAEETLGIQVKAYPFFLSPDNSSILYLSTFANSSTNDLKIVVGALDNHAGRKILHEYFVKSNFRGNLFYIDSANEFSCGEIVVGKKHSGKMIAPDRSYYYPDILKDNSKAAYEMSCEELNKEAPQHLATNGLAADLLFSYVVQLVLAEEKAEYAPGGIIFFDAFKLFSRFDPYEEERHGKIK